MMESLEELLEVAKRRSIGFFIAVIGLAYLMSLTSNSMWVNVPVAILMISLLRFLSFELEVRRRIPTPQVSSHLHKRHISTSDPLLYSSGLPLRWRKKIDAPAVEAAVDEFTRRLVHELIVDLWYSSITSDQEAPNELIVIINELLGEVSQRAKRVNLISLLTRDIVDLVRSHLELYRKVQVQIGVNVLDTCSFEERDEKLKKVLASSRKLHPAVVSPEAETQVLQRLMGGLLAVVLRPQDAQCKLLRCFARELLACAVLRPIMSFASPGFINELIEQSAIKAKESSKKKKRQRSSDFSSLQGPPERHISSKDETLSGLEMTEVPLPALESTLSSDGLESMEAVHGMKSKAYSGYSQAIKTMTGAGDSLTGVEPKEKAPGDSNSAKVKVGSIGGHEIVAVHSNESFVEGITGLRKHLSDDHSNIVQGVFEGDWAHVLEVVSQRKTQALAPEHLDNLWAKGRNYKKREIMKSLAKPAELENMLIARCKGSSLKPPPKHTYNDRAKEGLLKESSIGASLIDVRTRPTEIEHWSSSERLDKLDAESTKSKLLRISNESSVKLQEVSRKGNVAENSALIDSLRMESLETQVSDSNSTVRPHTIWHPLESYEASQSCETSGSESRTSVQLRRTKSSDSGLDGWHEQVKKSEGSSSQHLEALSPSQRQVIGAANNSVMSGTSMEFNNHDVSSMIALPSAQKLQCRVC
ncbi:hypothetical protein O6H91_04G130700 [Diphasiastrum complanatum]|uniref:Uncharacterized protein n=1 Tax=Diphasiastrum complanatum TaxID=34168 RepID=A0ACC2E226_DIPCM|nr:hypothetical protein O6H91_04G130700 [Diphasiastrum complanatum]